MTALIPLSAQPTRAELRSAISALQTLAKLGSPGAAEEAATLATVMRFMFPRKREAGDALPAARRVRIQGGKRNRLISDLDCLGTCPSCSGSGHGTTALDGSFSWLRCHRCAGQGRICLAAAQARVDGPRRQIKLRGDNASLHTGVSDMPRYTPAPHSRGSLGKRRIGAMTFHEEHIADDYRVTQDPADLDFTDVTAELEAGAMRDLRKLRGTLGWEPAKGRRLLGSQRDTGILTDGQQKRSLMADRVRKYQQDHGKQLRRLKAAEEAPLKAVLKALAKAGIDPKVALQQAAQSASCGGVDDAEPAPAVFWGSALVMVGHHAGKRGRINTRSGYRYVIRPGGKSSTDASKHYRLDFPDGSFDVFHCDDLAEIVLD